MPVQGLQMYRVLIIYQGDGFTEPRKLVVMQDVKTYVLCWKIFADSEINWLLVGDFGEKKCCNCLVRSSLHVGFILFQSVQPLALHERVLFPDTTK